MRKGFGRGTYGVGPGLGRGTYGVGPGLGLVGRGNYKDSNISKTSTC